MRARAVQANLDLVVKGQVEATLKVHALSSALFHTLAPATAVKSEDLDKKTNFESTSYMGKLKGRVVFLHGGSAPGLSPLPSFGACCLRLARPRARRRISKEHGAPRCGNERQGTARGCTRGRGGGA